jgi:hypothetical protein
MGFGAGGEAGNANESAAILKNGIWYLYYSNGYGIGSDGKVATSTDGIHYSSPQVFIPHSAQPWFQGVANKGVLIDDDGIWKMLFEAGTGTGGMDFFKTGLATSTDGIHWTLDSSNNPLTSLEIGAGMYGGTRALYKIQGIYNLWYHTSYTSDLPTDISHAVSTDLIHWTVVSGNPIFYRESESFPNGSFVDQVADPTIIESNGTTYMFYDLDNNVGSYQARIDMASYAGTLQNLAARFNVTGPVSGTVGVASGNFTVALSAPASGSQAVTITSSNSGDTISPSVGSPASGAVTVTPPANATSVTFTLLPTSNAARTLTFTNGQGWVNPTPLTYSTQDVSLTGISPSSLPNATVGVAYSQLLTATGGSAPYTWSVSSGALPVGLSLATSLTNSTTTISGTPTVSGTSTFTIQVQSSGGATTTQSYTMLTSAQTVSSGGGGGGVVYPSISQVVVSTTTPTSATISWYTNYNTNSEVDYGTSTAYGLTQTNNTQTQSHALILSGLVPATTYQFRVKANLNGAITSSNNYTFTTLAVTTPATSISTSTPAGSSNPLANPSQSTGGSTTVTPLSFQLPYPSNTLVLDNGVIYLIMGQAKLGFASMKAFKGLGYSLKNVINGDASAYPQTGVLNSSSQAHPDGSWIISGKAVVYVSPQGYIPVSTWDIFLSNGGQSRYIVRANWADNRNKRPVLRLMTEHDNRVQ